MKKRLLSILLTVVMVMGIIPAFGVVVMAEDSLPTVTSVVLTGEGITYDAEHRFYIIPTDMTADVTITISGTNFANMNENCFFKYSGNAGSAVYAGTGWTIDTANNTATKSVGASVFTDSSDSKGFEFKFSTNGGSFYDLKGIGYWAICADENPYAGEEEITIPDSLPEITNEIARAFENGSEQASYSEGNSWSGAYWSDENIYAHFAVNLATGDVVYYELSDFVTVVGLADTKQDEWPQSYDYIALPKKGFIEVEKDGEYVFFADRDVKVKAYCEIHGVITHQPTTEEPYVEVNLPEGAAYQWYKVTSGEVEVINDGELAGSYETSYYEEGVGWHGFWWDSSYANYFEVYLYEGDKITIIPSAYCIDIGIFNDDDGYGGSLSEVEAGGEFTYTAEGDGWYDVYAYSDINDDTTLRAYTEGTVYAPIESETAARLVTTAPGEYYCEVTFADGSTKESDSFVISMFTHQPTWEEPYVEVVSPEGATYQWYKIEGEKTEVVDDGEIGESYYDSYYEEGVGWQGDWWGYDGADYFWVCLNEGEKITIIPSAYCDEIGIYNEDTGDGTYIYDVSAGDELIYTAEIDGWYYVYAYTYYEDETTLRAYIGEETHTPIEGETATRLGSLSQGKFYCAVALSDGTEEKSYSFEVPVITHQPTLEEPYVEVVNPEGAIYQWYKVTIGNVEVVNDGETGESYDDSDYEDGVGWQGSWWGYDGADYFRAYLHKGDTITVIPSAYCNTIGIRDEMGEYDNYFYEIEAGGKVTYTAEGEAWYTVYAYTDYADDTTLRAYIEGELDVALEGETAARLSTLSRGKYYCAVALSDGTEEKSDSFEINKVKVTIDGVETEVDGFIELGAKNEDGTYSLPENVVGYYIDEKLAPAGKYEVSGGEVITTVEFNITMLTGAQVRYGGGLDENGKVTSGNGLRFIATVDRSEFDAIGYGMKLTAEGSSMETIVNAEKWQDDTTFSVALTDMAESNYIRKFTATPFVKVKYDDGTEKTIYGTDTVTRSIYQVAAGLLKDETQTAYGLSDVLNAYANQTGIRLVVKDGELKANTNYTESGSYNLTEEELHFEVSGAEYDQSGNKYSVILTALGNAEIITDNDYWYDYIRINNNNSLIKDKVTVERVEGNSKAVKVTFAADGLIERPSDSNDNTIPDNAGDDFDGETDF
ncbi:MAG: hypothetical protein IJC69_05120 [Clostridia bacterium]|nr:hypothetical protein [Clostridia bacterium]